MLRTTGSDPKVGGAAARCMELMAQTLQLEYRFIVYYARLAGLIPDDEGRRIVRMLGEDSLRHMDTASQAIRDLGGTPLIPPLEPFPELPVADIFRRQLEYEKLALMLHSQAAALAAPQWREPLLDIAGRERIHILGVKKILDSLARMKPDSQ